MSKLLIESINQSLTCTELCSPSHWNPGVHMCGKPARFLVGFKDEGEPMCLRHARQHALTAIMTETYEGER